MVACLSCTCLPTSSQDQTVVTAAMVVTSYIKVSLRYAFCLWINFSNFIHLTLNIDSGMASVKLELSDVCPGVCVSTYSSCLHTEFDAANFDILSPYRKGRILRFKPNMWHISIYSLENRGLNYVSGTSAYLCTGLFVPTTSEPRAGSVVVRIDPLRFLAGCRTRRLNQV